MEKSDGGPVTILFVDDDPVVRKIACATLRAEGYTVLDAPDGPGAQAMASRFQVPVDLLVTDYVMPGMNGRELSRSLRPRFPAMKVLYISGHIEDATVQEQILDGAFKEGAQFLQKPFNGPQLARKVRACLQGIAGR